MFSRKETIYMSETQKELFEQLLLCHVEPPILAYLDHYKEFILHFNAEIIVFLLDSTLISQ